MDLLQLLFDRLIEKTNLSKTLYIPLQRDFVTAKEFFAFGPDDTRKVASRLRSRSGLVSQAAMDRLITRDFTRALL